MLTFKEIWKKLTFKDLLLILLLLFSIGTFIAMRHYKAKAEKQQAEFVDTLSVYKNKLGEEYKARQISMMTIKELKARGDSLSAELKNLKDHPIVITKIKTKVEIKEVYIKSDSIIGKDSINTLYWSQREQNGYFSIAGNTQVKKDFSWFNTKLSTLEVDAMMTLDVIEQDKAIKVLARSSNPYIKVDNVQGVLIDPTTSETIKKCFPKKRWGIGVQVGAGIGNEMKLTPYIGIGLSWSLIQF